MTQLDQYNHPITHPKMDVKNIEIIVKNAATEYKRDLGIPDEQLNKIKKILITIYEALTARLKKSA